SPCLRNLRVFQMGDIEGDNLPSNLHPDFDKEDPIGWCHTSANGLEHVIAGMPNIEELTLLCKQYDIDRLVSLPNLGRRRVLRLSHFVAPHNHRDRKRYAYPLNKLAANPALGNLTHLLFHPHYPESHKEREDWDHPPSFLPLKQVRALLRSPYLRRLTHLQLRISDMGDEGVRLLIESGVLRQVKWA